MTRFSTVLIAATVLSFPAAAQPGSNARANEQSTTGVSKPDERDAIGLTSTQRQMIALCIAGIAEKQPSPQDFGPSPGRSCRAS